MSGKWQQRKRFQSTLPVGGATNNAGEIVIEKDISIHAPRGGSDGITST